MTQLFHRLIAAHGLLLFACLAWGGSYAVGRFGLNSGSAVWLTLWRWAPGALIFALYLVLCGPQVRQVILTEWRKLALISALGVAIYPATLFLAVAQTTAINASLYLAVTPVLIVIASALIWRERISVLNVAAIGLGLLGACVLLFRGDLNLLLSFRVASSDFWAVISALSWAAYCVSLPMKPKALTELQFLAAIVVMGCCMLFGAGVFVGLDAIPTPSTTTTAISMIYFAIFPSILAFLAWNFATSRVGPSVAAPYNNLVPLLGGVLGIVFLNETIEAYHIIGGSVIVVGLLLNGLRK